MELINYSGLPVEQFTALDRDGRERLVIVAKATYGWTLDGVSRPAEAHRPIAVSDRFVGDQGVTAPVYEADLAPHKRHCDVLLNATAHAPEGRPVTEVPVAVRIGEWAKEFMVVGDRTWRRGAQTVASAPRPFRAIPLHYGRAFGGSPSGTRDAVDGRNHVYESNPVGTGFFPDPDDGAVEQIPLPNTQDPNEPVTTPDGSFRPLAFGPIGRNWGTRRRYLGTTDARWRATRFPLMPEDFDETYYQAAPSDQQIPYLRGGEQVALRHLVPGRPIVRFVLPRLSLTVKVLRRSRVTASLTTVVDTLFIEPESSVYTIVYRASLALDRQGVSGVELVAAGPVCQKWWNAQVFGVDDCGCGGASTGEAVAGGSGRRPTRSGDFM